MLHRPWYRATEFYIQDKQKQYMQLPIEKHDFVMDMMTQI